MQSKYTRDFKQMEEVTFVVIYSVRRYTCLPGNNRLRLVFYHQAATRRARKEQSIVLSVVTISASGRVGREIRRGDAVCRFEYFHFTHPSAAQPREIPTI